MFSASMLRRLFSPLISGLRHVFYRPITIKYPYEKTNAVPEENYRFDPKQGVAYPGYKGRHILNLDKCTGCGTCDRTCENIAEAITMVFGYKIYIKIQKQLYENFKNDPKLTEALEKILESFKGDLKTIKAEEEHYVIELTDEPVFNYRCEVVYENLLENSIEDLKKDGWTVEISDYKSPEIMKFKISRDNIVLELAIEKLDFGFKQNRRSIFPAVDYGRCVFCGFCVDACPFNAIEMTPVYELSVFEREELLYNPLMLSTKYFETYPPETNWAEKTIILMRRYR
ncbi:MAG: 4Fe-4S binding protein [Nitrososphaerota archaeon]